MGKKKADTGYPKTCWACGGSGKDDYYGDGTDIRTCGACGGTGRI